MNDKLKRMYPPLGTGYATLPIGEKGDEIEIEYNYSSDGIEITAAWLMKMEKSWDLALTDRPLVDYFEAHVWETMNPETRAWIEKEQARDRNV